MGYDININLERGANMNKRFLVMGLLILVAMALIVPAAFAADDATAQAKAWFEQKFAAKQAWVDQAVKDGRLTAEQGKFYTQHFEQMKEFQAQNGYICPGGGMGQCRGLGPGKGMGPGMGGRWMNNPQVQPQS